MLLASQTLTPTMRLASQRAEDLRKFLLTTQGHQVSRDGLGASGLSSKGG
jgi:hypothetical protein